MKKVFGTETCHKCIALRKQLEEKGESYIYYDLGDTEDKEVQNAYTEAIARAAFDSKLSKDSGLELPFVLEE